MQRIDTQVRSSGEYATDKNNFFVYNLKIYFFKLSQLNLMRIWNRLY